MEKFFRRGLEWFRSYRSAKFGFLGRFFLRIGISANIMTSISLILGLLGVYFLFLNHLLFIVLIVLYLLADGLDGIIARASQPTSFGAYLDYAVDHIIYFLLLLRIGFVLDDYFVFTIAGLFLISHGIHLFSSLKSTILVSAKTITLILVVFKFFILAYLVTGVVTLYSLAKQLQWYVGRRI